ncbi:MAG: 4Fe-4S ferredoxin, partial [Fidelibacterota bacterium]
MGHAINSGKSYRLLQQRLDRNLTGAPDSPTFLKILRLLFSPEEAELARQLPSRLTPLETLSQRLNIPPDELGDKLTT